MLNVKRRYRSPRRQEQAIETRRRILQSAVSLFGERGFGATSIREIADAAGVSEQTIYKAFIDKIGLLSAAGEAYIESGAEGSDEAFLAVLRAEPDPVERCRIVAQNSRELWESGALELDLMLFGSSDRDPRLDELHRRSLGYRLETTRAVCEVLFPDEIRHPGFTMDDIAAFGTALDSAAMVTMLGALGWDLDRWEQWLGRLLTLFLAPERRTDREREPS
jgi:AcrR family transcriptional regulator